MAGACVPFASESRELSAATSLQSEPSRDRLRVTGMETFTVRATARTNWIFVRLLTNQGLTGLGEASLGRQTALDERHYSLNLSAMSRHFVLNSFGSAVLP